jgi:hypothetical protein
MIKPLLFSGMLAFTATAALAQNSAPPGSLASETFKQHLRAQYLANDTAQALINLYSRRQAGGASWIVGSALAAARIATSGNSSTTTGSGYVVEDNSNNAGAAFLVAVPIIAYGVAKLVHYRNSSLEQILTGYAAGQPLTRRLRRKLKPRFFDQPIIEYTPVPVTPAK